jgi:hypothetical protein
MAINIDNAYDVDRQLYVLNPAVSINLRESESPGPDVILRLVSTADLGTPRQDLPLVAESQLCGTACMRRKLGAEEMPRGCIVVDHTFS